jgi:superfamily I DNA/RNA helicase
LASTPHSGFRYFTVNGESPVYDAVVVDEAQDLDPNTLRLLTQLCRHPNRLFITADANQSIYGSSFRWNDIHQDLKFVGRTGILKVNQLIPSLIKIPQKTKLPKFLNESVAVYS